MSDAKRLFVVHEVRRKRVTSLTPEQRRTIVYLFDALSGDYDAVAQRCGILGVQRADVLAIVLADTRKGPQSEPGMGRLGITRRQTA